MDRFTKLFKLDGFAEHQKSKKLQYTPVQASLLLSTYNVFNISNCLIHTKSIHPVIINNTVTI